MNSLNSDTATRIPTMPNKKNRSESLTFRVDADTLQKLRLESSENQITLNALVNQVLSSFADWDVVVSKAGWELLPKNVLKELFDAIDEETLAKVASKAAPASREIRLMLTGLDDMNSYYMALRFRMKKSGYVMREYDEPSGTKRIVIQHDMGLNWSIFFKEYNERIINSLGYKVEFEISQNSVMMKISE